MYKKSKDGSELVGHVTIELSFLYFKGLLQKQTMKSTLRLWKEKVRTRNNGSSKVSYNLKKETNGQSIFK